MKRCRGALVILVAAWWLAAPAYALWSSSATGTATAKSATLDPPSGLGAACYGGVGGLLTTQVRLTWTASATASLGPVVYEVQWGTSLASITPGGTTTALSYDTGALAGSLFGTTYYFAVRSRFGDLWLSSNSNSVQKSIGLASCSG
jgi:hypothetical protein